MECGHANKESKGKQIWCVDCNTLLDSGPVVIDVPVAGPAWVQRLKELEEENQRLKAELKGNST